MTMPHAELGNTTGLLCLCLDSKAAPVDRLTFATQCWLAALPPISELQPWFLPASGGPATVAAVSVAAGVLLLWALQKFTPWTLRGLVPARLFWRASSGPRPAAAEPQANTTAAPASLKSRRASQAASMTSSQGRKSSDRRPSWYVWGIDLSRAAQDVLTSSTSGALRMASEILSSSWADDGFGQAIDDSWDGFYPTPAAGTSGNSLRPPNFTGQAAGNPLSSHSSSRRSLLLPRSLSRHTSNRSSFDSLLSYISCTGAVPVQAYSEVPEHHNQVLVLYVDKDPADQSAITAMLESGPRTAHRFKVATARCGQEALDMVFSSRYLPDVVLMDTNLPDMKASEVCRILRNSFSPAELPIVLATSSSGQPDALAALEKGVNDFIVKPLNQQELLARMNSQMLVKQNVKREAESRSHYDLLVQVLPPHIIARLAQGQAYVPEHHDQVTILFSDIVGFTEICSHWQTQKVVTMLDLLFSCFDDLCDKHSVFKVETIGDAYMVASGHEGSKDHALRMAAMAVDMLDAVRGLEEQLGTAVRIRIGMHTGPSLSGVVGKRRPRYCFFGDTVNTASRMESTGFPMTIQISHSCKLSMIAAAESRPAATARGLSGDADLQRRLTPVAVPGNSIHSASSFFLPTSRGVPMSMLSSPGTTVSPSRLQTAARLSARRPSSDKHINLADLQSSSAVRPSSAVGGQAALGAVASLARALGPVERVRRNSTLCPAAAETALVAIAEEAADGSIHSTASDAGKEDSLANASGGAVPSGSHCTTGDVNCLAPTAMGPLSTIDSAVGCEGTQEAMRAAQEPPNVALANVQEEQYPGLPFAVINAGWRCVKGKGCLTTHLLKVGDWQDAVLAIRAEQAEQAAEVAAAAEAAESATNSPTAYNN